MTLLEELKQAVEPLDCNVRDTSSDKPHFCIGISEEISQGRNLQLAEVMDLYFPTLNGNPQERTFEGKPFTITYFPIEYNND